MCDYNDWLKDNYTRLKSRFVDERYTDFLDFCYKEHTSIHSK